MNKQAVLQGIFRKTSRISRVSYRRLTRDELVIKKGSEQIKRLADRGLAIPVALS